MSEGSESQSVRAENTGVSLFPSEGGLVTPATQPVPTWVAGAAEGERAPALDLCPLTPSPPGREEGS